MSSQARTSHQIQGLDHRPLGRIGKAYRKVIRPLVLFSSGWKLGRSSFKGLHGDCAVLAAAREKVLLV